MNSPLVQTRGLCKYFKISERSGLKRKVSIVKAVDEIDLKLSIGDTLALVGESGSGKTTLGKTIIRLLEPTKGEIWFEEKNISHISGSDWRKLREDMQMVFQDPTSSLNPRKTILDIVSLPLKIHSNSSKTERKRQVIELLDIVDIPEEYLTKYPSALSGGQKQRVGIARALILYPKLVVLDEPTSSLDVSVQAKVLSLLDRIKRQFDLTYLYISHDLSVVRNIADEIIVMYLGKEMEMANTSELFNNPTHPYTRALLSSIPVISETEKDLIPLEITLKGDIPSPTNPPVGCVFSTRCQDKTKECDKIEPSVTKFREGHFVKCIRVNSGRSQEWH